MIKKRVRPFRINSATVYPSGLVRSNENSIVIKAENAWLAALSAGMPRTARRTRGPGFSSSFYAEPADKKGRFIRWESLDVNMHERIVRETQMMLTKSIKWREDDKR